MSSNAYARRPRLPRPISISVTMMWPFPLRLRCPVSPTRAGGAVREPPGRPSCSRGALLLAVVRCFDRHLDVVRVALLEARRGDPHEAALALHLVHGRGAHVAHGLAEAADELVQHVGEGAAVGDLALDALGDELVVRGDLGLEVPVL